jgi:uncharacterized protein YlxW (UPF0749 family)
MNNKILKLKEKRKPKLVIESQDFQKALKELESKVRNLQLETSKYLTLSYYLADFEVSVLNKLKNGGNYEN